MLIPGVRAICGRALPVVPWLAERVLATLVGSGSDAAGCDRSTVTSRSCASRVRPADSCTSRPRLTRSRSRRRGTSCARRHHRRSSCGAPTTECTTSHTDGEWLAKFRAPRGFRWLGQDTCFLKNDPSASPKNSLHSTPRSPATDRRRGIVSEDPISYMALQPAPKCARSTAPRSAPSSTCCRCQISTCSTGSWSLCRAAFVSSTATASPR